MGKEYQDNADTLLWNNFIKGNEDAFRVIYKYHVRSLFKYGCHFTHDESLIKDCIHDVFIDLYRYRTRLKATNNIKLYLFKSIKRKIIDSLSKTGVIGSLEIEQIPFLYTVSSEEELLNAESEQLKYQLLEKAMGTLTPRQKEAIYLKYVSDLSYDELSQVMQLNYQSARNLVFRGLEKLRESFPRNLLLIFLPKMNPKGIIGII